MSIELNPIANPEKIGGFNTNFQLIEDELNENVLRRQGLSPGEANHMEVSLDMNSNSILNVSTDTSDPGSLLSLGDADTRFVFVSGDTMTGNLSMGGFGVTNLRTPTSSSEATRKDYVDSGLAGKVSKSGDSMSGDLNMVQNDINNIGTTRTGNLILNGVQVNPNELNESGVIWVKTLADLQALPTGGLVDGQAADIRGGVWYWDSESERWLPERGLLDIRAFGADPSGVMESSQAIIDAKQFAHDLFLSGIRTVVYAPAGTYLVNQGLGEWDFPAGFMGQGSSETFFQVTSEYTGWFLDITSLGMSDVIQQDDDTHDVSLNSTAAFGGFSILGNRSYAEGQHGVRQKGTCDQLRFSDIRVDRLTGTGWHEGAQSQHDGRGTCRESHIENVTVFRCGTQNHYSAIFASVPPEKGLGDGHNNNCYYNIRIVYPEGRGTLFSDYGTNGQRRNQFYGIFVHGKVSNLPSPVHPLVEFVGNITGMMHYGFRLTSGPAGVPAITVKTMVNLEGTSVNGDFVAFETVTGQTSGASATLMFANTFGTAKMLSVVDASGDFSNGEDVVGGTSGASMTVDNQEEYRPVRIQSHGDGITNSNGDGLDIQSGGLHEFHWSRCDNAGTDVIIGDDVNDDILLRGAAFEGEQSLTYNIASGKGNLVATHSSVSDDLPAKFKRIRLGQSNAMIMENNGNPEGVVSAAPGSVCVDRSGAGSADDVILYGKTTGFGNTGWRPFMVHDSTNSANRPTTNLYEGRYHYDSELQKPIWYDTAAGTWRDAVGSAV